MDASIRRRIANDDLTPDEAEELDMNQASDAVDRMRDEQAEAETAQG